MIWPCHRRRQRAYDVVRDVLSERAGVCSGMSGAARQAAGLGSGRTDPGGGSARESCLGPAQRRVFVRPLLDRFPGRRSVLVHRGRPDRVAVARRSPPTGAGALTTSAEGLLTAEPAHSGGSGSHLVTSMSADGYVMVAETSRWSSPGTGWQQVAVIDGFDAIVLAGWGSRPAGQQARVGDRWPSSPRHRPGSGRRRPSGGGGRGRRGAATR